MGPVNPTMSDVEQRAPSKEAQKKPALWSDVWPIDVWTGILTEQAFLPTQSANGIVELEHSIRASRPNNLQHGRFG